MSPFESLYRYKPLIESSAVDSVIGGEVPIGVNRVQEIITLRKRLVNSLNKAREA